MPSWKIISPGPKNAYEEQSLKNTDLNIFLFSRHPSSFPKLRIPYMKFVCSRIVRLRSYVLHYLYESLISFVIKSIHR